MEVSTLDHHRHGESGIRGTAAGRHRQAPGVVEEVRGHGHGGREDEVSNEVRPPEKGREVMLSDKEVLIGPHNAHLYAMDQVVDGEHKARGLVPRDYSKYPIGHYNSIRAFHAVDMPTIPQTEWSERLKDLTAQGARLSDVRARGNAGQSIPTRDQNGKGYCATADTECLTQNGWVAWPDYNWS